jgi:hypothetical protein
MTGVRGGGEFGIRDPNWGTSLSRYVLINTCLQLKLVLLSAERKLLGKPPLSHKLSKPLAVISVGFSPESVAYEILPAKLNNLNKLIINKLVV